MSDIEIPGTESSITTVTLPFGYDPGDGKAAVGIASWYTGVPYGDIRVVNSEVKGEPVAPQLDFMGRVATGVDQFSSIVVPATSDTQLVS